MLVQSLRLQCGVCEARAAVRDESAVPRSDDEVHIQLRARRSATTLNNLPRVLQLIQPSAPLELGDGTSGWTALLWACHEGNELVAKALLDGKYAGCGATIDERGFALRGRARREIFMRRAFFFEGALGGTLYARASSQRRRLCDSAPARSGRRPARQVAVVEQLDDGPKVVAHPDVREAAPRALPGEDDLVALCGEGGDRVPDRARGGNVDANVLNRVAWARKREEREREREKSAQVSGQFHSLPLWTGKIDAPCFPSSSL
jgi:hypothetical protein